MVHVNLSDVSNEFEVLPEGVYAATLTDVELVEPDEDSGKFPYFKCEFKYDESAGRAWRNLSTSPKAAFFMREALEAFGEEIEVLDDEEGFDLDMTNYIGAEVALHITIEPYRGKDSNTVAEILPPEALDEPAGRRSKKDDSEVARPKKSSTRKGGGTKTRRRKVV